MEDMLRCSNPDCGSRKPDNETPYFSINVTVGADCDVSENLRRVEPEYFACVYCHAEAEATGAKDED